MKWNATEMLDEIGSQRMRRSRDLIRASEVGDYVYCRRSWFLSAQGIAPSLKQIEKRHAGTEYHRMHGEQVRSAHRVTSAAVCVLFLLLFLALGYWLYLQFK